jgi:betaine-aldehyde dehydrogenase
VSRKQQEKALGMIKQGVSQGATLLYGLNGEKPTAKGFFVSPTILQIDSTDNVCWNEEIFGPVLCVKTFKTEKEAVALANDCKYGLAAAVFTEDKKRLASINNQLKVGIVWNQCSQPCFPQLPWGGTKLSGNTSRDLGGEIALHKYLEPKQIVKYVSKDALDWYDTSKL